MLAGAGTVCGGCADGAVPGRACWPVLLVLLFLNLLYLAVTGWPGVLGALVRVFGGRWMGAAGGGRG